MPSYAAFLRGVNLGATNKVEMPRLRSVAARLGLEGVRTHLNSGNLLFQTSTWSETDVAQALQDAIHVEFGRQIDVAVRSDEQLRAVLAANPYPDGDPSRVTVAFLTGPAPADVEQRLAARADEPFTVVGREVWVHYTRGQAGSRFAAQFSRIVGVSTTVRNVRTVTKVLALMSR